MSTSRWSGSPPTLVTLEDLAHIPCVIALGAPGLGKSTALREFIENLSVRDASACVVAYDLADIPSLDVPSASVFHCAEFENWRRSDGMLYCVLDSFDESPIPLESLRSALLDELGRLPRERFRFVLACRTAVLPPGFVASLERLFTPTPAKSTQSVPGSAVSGDEVEPHASPVSLAESSRTVLAFKGASCIAIEIAVLTRDDVRAAAAVELHQDDDGDGFIDALVASDAGAFAARPITLRALLRRYAVHSLLAVSQVDLYRDMCRELCDPVAPRPGSSPSRRTNREDRYIVASRLCAATLLGNLTGIFRGDGPTSSPALLDVADCLGTEWMDGLAYRVNEDVITEALNTALFTGVVDDRALAVHQTFAEFMAADWIVRRGMSATQILSLIEDPTDPERRIVPQLRQVAAWLAALDPTVLDVIAVREPEVLLSSDVVLLPLACRTGLVAALLRRTNQNVVIAPPFGLRRAYARLAHPALADQLAPVIQDDSLPLRMRECALELGTECRVGGLAMLAAGIACESEAPLGLRIEAARLVAAAGDTPARSMLMTLAADPPSSDEFDDLRGAALSACWDLLTPDELFALVVAPQRPNRTGMYSVAIRELAMVLSPGSAGEYVIAATRWLARFATGTEFGPLDDVADAALLLALENVSDPHVLAPLLTYVRRRIAAHMPFGDGPRRHESSPVRQRVAEAASIRQAIVGALLDGELQWRPSTLEMVVQQRASVHTVIDEDDPLLLMPPLLPVASEGDNGAKDELVGFVMPDLFPAGDVPWALARLAALPNGHPRRPVWRAAIRFQFAPTDPSHLSAAFEHRGDPDMLVASRGWTEGHDSAEAAREAVLQLVESQRQDFAAAEVVREASRTAQAERNRAAPLRTRIIVALANDASLASVEGDPADKEPARTTTMALGAGVQPTTPLFLTRWHGVFFELVRDADNRLWYHAEPTDAVYAALVNDFSPDERRQLVDAALAFLSGERGLDDPFPRNAPLPWVTLQGCVAAEVIARLASCRLSELAPTTWSAWLPTLVRHHRLGGVDNARPMTTILDAAATHAREQLTVALLDAMHAGSLEGGRGLADAAMDRAMRSEFVVAQIAQRVSEGAYSAEVSETLLRRLLLSGGDAPVHARTAARVLLQLAPLRRTVARGRRGASSVRSSGAAVRPDGPASAGGADNANSPLTARDLAVAAAAALLAADEDAGWPLIGAQLAGDRDFAQAVLLFGARHDGLLAAGSMDRLTSMRIADIYLLVRRTFPPETDPWHVGVYSPTSHDHIRDWRDRLLNGLEAQNSDASVEALRAIASALPENDWLVQTWRRAASVRFGSRWRGTPAQTLMRLADRRDARIAESGEQLLDVIVESIQRLDTELQGEWRSVVGLWDQQRDGPRHLGWLPKDEGHLSNEVARHLRRDLGERGIVVGRELVVQVGVPGGAPGLRTDLDVRALSAPSGSQPSTRDLRVIIEIKGSWNPEVLTAMQSQLLDDYLRPHDVQHGLFLVGLYTCDSWSECAAKDRSARLGDQATLLATLSAQASALSSPLRTIRALVLDTSLPAVK